MIADAMFGTAKSFRYDWGHDPACGDPLRHWKYHQAIYEECRRVLRPGGALAWGQGCKFHNYFTEWFGSHRIWTLTRYAVGGTLAVGNVWVVQTREQQPIEFPAVDSLVLCKWPGMALRKHHPCPKPVEEMEFLVEHLTAPGQFVLDCFCGLGSTLLAAKQLGRRWIGCDLSKAYCRVALRRLASMGNNGRP